MNKKTRPDYYKIGKYEPKDVISDWKLNFNLFQQEVPPLLKWGMNCDRFLTE